MAEILDAVINIYKKRSETPLQTIGRFVKAHPEFRKSRMTYAGRLDPMAEGVLVVLSGEKNKEREAYTGLDKVYEFEFVLGVDTDTHDLLGKVVAGSDSADIADDRVEAALRKYSGTFIQKYPAYSSKVVDGVPLFDLARKGRISDIIMPEHEVSVSEISLLGKRTVSGGELHAFINETVGAVDGDFRQKEILKEWDAYFAKGRPVFDVYKARVSCGSGFYVRRLVFDLGRDLGTGAVTVSILRTRVGAYKLEDSIRL